MVTINSGHVIYDNTWLWRADHSKYGETYNQDNPVKNGLIVNGDNVTTYGLAVEHTLGDLTVWNGENGATYWYQSELPYDAPTSFGTNGHTGFKVGSSVQNFTGYGIGVYCFFRDHKVTVHSGITSPSGSGIKFTNSMTVYLTG